jgi:hypothetical protein
MSDGKVVPIRPDNSTPEEREARRQYETPRLFQQENGLYGIMLAGCQVYIDLDPFGKREAIRVEALAECEENGWR